MNVLDISGIHKAYGARTILADAACTVDENDRIGLIGRNGSGKSTLLRIIAGLDEADGGTIMRRKGLAVGFLSQDPDLDEGSTVTEEIEKGLTLLRQAHEEYTRIVGLLAASNPDAERLLRRQGELAGWIEQHGGWNTDHRIAEIMSHINIPTGSERITNLSGGMKRRVALARVLIQSPDLMLLDEPTNHLDADAIEWLQEFLKNYRGAVILITHDRYFLDEVTERIIEVEDGHLTSFTGGYSGYLEAKADILQQNAERQARLLNLYRNESAWMHRGAKARTTKQKARINRFHALAEETAVQKEKDLALTFHAGDTLGGIVIEADNVTKSFSGKTLMKDLTFGMKRGERLGIIGPNGSGKTTLIRMILGQEPPDGGSIRLGNKAEIAYFDQLREIPDEAGTIYDYLGDGDYVDTPTGRRHKIGYLDEFLFDPSERMRKIYTLSGGERGRLILAKLMLGKANILILDEPTNDLDIPTLQLLDEALARFPGCVIMVTHDRFFLDKVATSILSFEGNGRVVKYEGNYSLYKSLHEQNAAIKPVTEAVKTAPRQDEAKKKTGLTYAERIELEKVETEIAELEPKKNDLEEMLANPACYDGYSGGVEKLSKDFLDLEETLGRLYGRWEELEVKRSA